jgi:hypothetical protein
MGGEVADRLNVLFFHVDNLGFGELSCYAGGPFRGARTERIDTFAAEGFRLTNYCPQRTAFSHSGPSGTCQTPSASSGISLPSARTRTLVGGHRCGCHGAHSTAVGIGESGRWPAPAPPRLGLHGAVGDGQRATEMGAVGLTIVRGRRRAERMTNL